MNKSGKVAIIGGGLAGSSIAFECKRYGLYPIVFERNLALASAASGNDTGLVSPRISAELDRYASYFSLGFQSVVRLFDEIAQSDGGDIGWHKCGTLHLMVDERKEKQFAKCVKNWGWDEKDMHMLSKGDVSQQAGIALDYAALFLPQSGSVSPRKLCSYYAGGVDVRYGQEVSDDLLGDLDADIIVLASANGLNKFGLARHIPFGSVRGQVTKVAATPLSSQLQCNLNYAGYCTPAQDGAHMIGATFQRWLTHTDILDEDDQENIAALRGAAPDLADGLEVVDHRAGLRCSVKDYFPVVGKLGQIGGKDVYISGGHGSHGILSSHMATQIIMDQILGRDARLPEQTLRALSPHRFL